MSELTWILDPTTGELTVEGLSVEEAATLANDVLPTGRDVNCARPFAHVALPDRPITQGETLRVYRMYHGSVVDGPGRRSVVQVQGCPTRCPFCYVPETHDPAGGVALGIDAVIAALLDPIGEPRDGVTILGGEPMAQPEGLAALLRELKARDLHTVVYTGYTLEALARRRQPAVREALALTDLLIDGPFIAALSEGAGEWCGSQNQRRIERPARMLDTRWALTGSG